MTIVTTKPARRKALSPAAAVVGAPNTAGNTKVSIAQQAVPRLPHERDESADSQTSAPRRVMLQAAKDIDRGLKDTDRGAEVNASYKKLKAAP